MGIFDSATTVDGLGQGSVPRVSVCIPLHAILKILRPDIFSRKLRKKIVNFSILTVVHFAEFLAMPSLIMAFWNICIE